MNEMYKEISNINITSKHVLQKLIIVFLYCYDFVMFVDYNNMSSFPKPFFPRNDKIEENRKHEHVTK